jgi:hypothetical protein
MPRSSPRHSGPQPRRSVVGSSRLNRYAVERVDGGAIARGERDVHGSGDGRSFLDPEVSAPVGGEAQRPLRALHDSDIERLQRLHVEGATEREIADAQRHVIEQRRLGFQHESPQYPNAWNVETVPCASVRECPSKAGAA